MKRCNCMIPKPVASNAMTCNDCGGEIFECCMYRECYSRGVVKVGYYYYCVEHAKKMQERENG